MANLEYSLPNKSGDRANLKVRAAGLIVACPVSQDNPAICPLRAVRHLSLRERYRWLDSLEPLQLRRLLEQHAECIVTREHSDHEPA